MRLNFLRTCFRIFQTIILTIFIFPLFLSFVALPLVIWRLFVIQLAKYLRHDFLRPASLLTGIFAVDNIYEKPQASLATFMHIDGPLDISEIKKRVKEAAFCGKRPEMQCVLEHWMGNFFLRKCDNFNIENHLKVYDASNKVELENVTEQLLTGPWERNQPLWDLHFFPNMKVPEMGTSSCFIFRYHHSFMDAVSFECLAKYFYDPDPALEEEVDNFIKKIQEKYTPSFFMKILAGVYLVLVAPFTTVYKILDATESNFWTVKEEDQIGKTSSHISVNELDLSWLKQIGQKVGKNATVLLTEAFSVAIRTHFLEQSGKNEIKRDIHAVYGLPRPGHPGKHELTNHFMFEFLSFPISEQDRKRRLDKISGQFRTIMTTPQPLATFTFTLMHALLCTFANRHIRAGGVLRKRLGSFVYSNVMIYGRPLKFSGHECKFLIPQTGLHSAENSVSITAMSYNGTVSIILRADNKLFPNKESCKRFIDNAIQELRSMDNESLMTQVV